MLQWLHVERSFNQFVSANYSETAVHWPNTDFDPTGRAEWVSPFLDGFAGRAWQHTALDRGEVRVRVFCERDSRTDRPTEIADAVRTALERKDVPVYAYGTSSSTALAWLRVYEGQLIKMPMPGRADVSHWELVFPADLNQAR